MSYGQPAIVQSTEQKILDLFHNLQQKWVLGMDVTSYRAEKARHENLVMVMQTFMDDRLVDIGAKLVDKGKTTVNPWVLWMSGAEFKEYAAGCSVYFRSQFFADKARNQFSIIMAETLGKPITFQYDKNVKDRLNMRYV